MPGSNCVTCIARWFALLALLWPGVAALAVRTASGAEAIQQRSSPIQLNADWVQEWDTPGGRVAVFRGKCQLTQGPRRYSAEKMVVWHDADTAGAGSLHRIEVYLEDDVTISDGDQSRSEPFWYLVAETEDRISLTSRGRKVFDEPQSDAFLVRAEKRRREGPRGQIEPTQYTLDPEAAWIPPGPGTTVQPDGVRRVRFFSRYSTPFNVQSKRNDNVIPAEQVVLITGGINVIADGVTINGEDPGTLDLAADRVMIWSQGTMDQFNTEMIQRRELPLQMYLEGDIVIRQGSNTIRAERAFYDLKESRALIYQADLESDLPMLDASLRVRAERLRQRSENSFHAQGAWVTTSQFGKPGYRLQATDVFLDRRDWSPWELANARSPQFSGSPPGTMGQPSEDWVVTAQNTSVLIGDVPIFYSPQISFPAEDPGIPIQGVVFRQDRIFGTQLRTRWDPFKLFGLEKPAGTRASLGIDVLSQRGPQVSLEGAYRSVDQWGNPFFGLGNNAFVYDTGRDNLGLDRRALDVSNDARGQLMLRHRHYLSPDTFLAGELGYASDRNFREQYQELNFDRDKDMESMGYLKQKQGAAAWSLLARPQVNNFENTTQWLPRADGYVLGQDLFGGLVNWSTHSSLGYGDLRQAVAPSNPADIFQPLPYFADAQGVVGMTRHELVMPFNVGALKVTPFALGEAAYWGDSLTGDALDRLYGRGGVRASIPFWRAYPWIQSDFFNLNGLAHRIVLNAEYAYAAATEPITKISQWNEFDEDSQERFRERFVINQYGGVLPNIVEPRFYAIRSDAATSVTAPYHELVDDQQIARLGLSQRLQTRVGPPERQRLKDWMTLDLGANYYPQAARDNFGQSFGLASGRYSWYVGDRTSLHATALYDFYAGGQELWSFGVLSQRSTRGSVYVGIRQISASTLDSRILTASYSYTLSPKWVTTAGTAFDLGEGMNRGQSMTLTRIGADFLVHFGFNYDASKDNLGFAINVEPRFGNRRLMGPTNLGPLLGAGY